MSDPFGRGPGEPLVVVVNAPFMPDTTLQEMLSQHAPGCEVHFTVYNESRELRAAKGVANGRDPGNLATPEITDDMKSIWQTAHVLVGIDLPADVASLCPKLRLFQTVSAGIDHVDQQLLQDAGVRLASASGIASASIAEFVMARLLQEWKHLRDIDTDQRDGLWNERFGNEVGGRTMLIAGLGSIGRQLARRARAFDMTVIATRGSASPGDTDPDVDELWPAAAIDELLPRADAVVCTLPANAATMDFFDQQRFDAMKSDAIFCNVGRGSLVVEADLVETLERGHLRAAILDVMRSEPLPADDPLRSAPRIYLSSHLAVSTDRYQANAWVILEENVRRMLAGERLHNEIDLVGTTG